MDNIYRKVFNALFFLPFISAIPTLYFRYVLNRPVAGWYAWVEEKEKKRDIMSAPSLLNKTYLTRWIALRTIKPAERKGKKVRVQFRVGT